MTVVLGEPMMRITTGQPSGQTPVDLTGPAVPVVTLPPDVRIALPFVWTEWQNETAQPVSIDGAINYYATLKTLAVGESATILFHRTGDVSAALEEVWLTAYTDDVILTDPVGGSIAKFPSSPGTYVLDFDAGSDTVAVTVTAVHFAPPPPQYSGEDASVDLTGSYDYFNWWDIFLNDYNDTGMHGIARLTITGP